MAKGGRIWWGRRWLACVLAGVSSWLWQAGPAYQDGTQMTQRVHEMAQQEIQMQIMQTDELDDTSSEMVKAVYPLPQVGRHASKTLSGLAAEPSHLSGDVAALVQWHTLMREHQLSGWLGRVVPRTSMSPAEATTSARPGEIWRLEGTASYAQGVAVLDALARDFPGVMLLHVQARHTPDGQTLRWLVELRWTAAGLKLPSPVAWPQVQGVDTDPFSPDRLKPSRAAVPVPLTDVRATAHVLPHVSVRGVRLAGVVSGEQGHQAVVTAIMRPNATTTAAYPGVSPVPAWHALREGQLVGEERARVLSIEPTRVVLEQTGQAAGKGQGLPMVLELASVASTFTSLPGRWQP